jgi:hypothetical protein
MSEEGSERNEEAEVARVGLDRLRPDEALYEHFENRPVPVGRDPTDGLPTPTLQRHTFAPPLALDTLVCLPDESSFVRRERSWGTVLKMFSPDEVEQMPNGRWRHKVDLLEVEPVRPRCRHFVRQFMDITDDDKGGMLERCCTARRDSGGEFLSLMNAQMAACELREPRDMATEDLIRRYDRLKIQLGAERRRDGAGLDLTKVGVDENADLKGVID